jgi:hypothetical protein
MSKVEAIAEGLEGTHKAGMIYPRPSFLKSKAEFPLSFGELMDYLRQGIVARNVTDAIDPPKAAAKRFDDMMESTPRMHEDSEKMSAKGSGSEARPAGFEPATLGSED